MAKHHPSWTRKKQLAVCYNMWRKRKMKENEDNNKYQEFTLEVPMIKKSVTVTIEEVETEEGKTITHTPSEEGKRAVAIVGDRFYKGNFLPAKELEKVYKKWENTLHDINHRGTGDLFTPPDIKFFVGYQDNVAYDSKTKEVSMDIHVNEKTHYGEAWRGYVDLCEEAGLIPNVSIAFMAKVKMIKVKDLPKGVKYDYGDAPEKDAVIPCIYDIIPQALSTVWKGACSDKDGCGIRTKCKSGKCDLSEEDYEKRRNEIIKELRKEDI